MPCKLSILIIEDSGTVGTQNWGIRCLPILINEQAGGRIGSASNSLLKLLRIPSERHALSSKWQYIWDSVNLVWPAIFFFFLERHFIVYTIAKHTNVCILEVWTACSTWCMHSMLLQCMQHSFLHANGICWGHMRSTENSTVIAIALSDLFCS